MAFFTKVTDVGAAKITAAMGAGVKMAIAHIVVGDANGVEYEPVGSETALVHQVWEGAVSSLTSVEKTLTAEVVIPYEAGGFTIREIGMVDSDGVLIAIGNYPATMKPSAADGAPVEMLIRMQARLSTDAVNVITFTIDDGTVYATRDYADQAASTAVSGHAAAENPHPQYKAMATTDAPGIVEIATADEVTAGVDGERVVTPLTLAGRLSTASVGGASNAADSVNVRGGFEALMSVTTGADNTAFGRHAGRAITVGGSNTLIGNLAGRSLVSGSHNIAIGGSALTEAESSDNVAIGYDAGGDITTGTRNILIGSSAGNLITEGCDNVALGYGSGGETTMSRSVAIGTLVLADATGPDNVAVGYHAGQNITTGESNTLVGSEAGGEFAGAYANTAVGYRTLATGASGYDNVAVGHFALAGGGSAWGNTAVGAAACNSNTTGQANVGIGASALRHNSAGNENVAVGYQAGLDLTGDHNTAIGYRADYGANDYDNCSCIGYSSIVTGSDQVQLGNSATTTYVYGTVQNRSDARDKADIEDSDLGLEFINALRPRRFKWDYREDYITRSDDEDGYPVDVENPKDGSKKRSRNHYGLIAQELKAVMDAVGVDFGGFQDHSVAGGQDVLSIGYDELIAPMIKAIQELSARVRELENSR